MVVSGTELQDQAVGMLRDWVANLGDGVARLEESANGPVRLVRILPRRSGAASMEFEIGRNGTFGLHVECGVRIDSLELSGHYLIEICTAVAQGALEEERWLRKGKVLKCKGLLRLPSGDLGGTEFASAFGGLGATERVRHQFEPYRSTA